MGYSAKIYFNTYSLRRDGTCAIYLAITINSKLKRIPLQLTWPACKCDVLLENLILRKVDDPDIDDYRVILADAKAKANTIFKYFRLNEKPMSIERFMKRWEGNAPGDSFIEYFISKNKQRLRDKIISSVTYKSFLRTLRKLKLWKKEILFADLDENSPDHPSLQFKKLSNRLKVYSIRIIIQYRTLGRLEADTSVWFGIGSHNDYDQIIYFN